MKILETRFQFPLLGKAKETQNEGSTFLPVERDLFLWFGEGQIFFSRCFKEAALTPSQVLLVLTDSYLIVAKSVTTISSSSAGRLIHSFFLEQAFGILGARIYFSFQWRAAVGHLANVGAIPHSRGMEPWSFGIPEASRSCRSFTMPRLVSRPAEPRALFFASWDWKLRGRCNSTGVGRTEMQRKTEKIKINRKEFSTHS